VLLSPPDLGLGLRQLLLATTSGQPDVHWHVSQGEIDFTPSWPVTSRKVERMLFPVC
jgi:hypothetical protein